MYHNFIGIDISKDTFVTASYGLNLTQTFDNTQAGFTAFCTEYRSKLKDALVVLETTGGYEMALTRFLLSQEITVHRANTRNVKYFIKSLGKQAKSDAIDAGGLASYGYERHLRLEPFTLKNTGQHQLQQLVQRHLDLKQILVQEKNRLKAPDSNAFVIKNLKKTIKFIESQCESIKCEIATIMETTPQYKEKQVVLESVPGIGKTISASLIALLPELGKVKRRQIASLVGVAPHPYESGQMIGYRRTKGGRSDVRCILFMAAMAACQSKSNLGDFYRSLIARGKKKMVAMVALIRKILVIANARMTEFYSAQLAPSPENG